MRLPGEVSALLRAGVRLRRQVLREPLRGVPHRLPGEETHLRGPQQGLLLQRYRDSYGGWGRAKRASGAPAVWPGRQSSLNDVLTPAGNAMERPLLQEGGVGWSRKIKLK